MAKGFCLMRIRFRFEERYKGRKKYYPILIKSYRFDHNELYLSDPFIIRNNIFWSL